MTTTCQILDFGAVGDGVTLNTAAINTAIAACASAGGGTVVVPPGVFISGTVVLRSNITLHLDAGAAIKGSPHIADYAKDVIFNPSEGVASLGLVYARDAENIAITGQGTIHGSGTHFMHSPDRTKVGDDFDRRYTRQGDAFDAAQVSLDGPVTYDPRPGMMLTIERCRRVTLDGVSLLDPPEWSVRLEHCESVLVHGVRIETNLLVPNADGVHLNCCRSVRIADCEFSCGDDAIAISGYDAGGMCENVVVSNCILRSRSSGVRIDNLLGSVRRCLLSNLIIHDSNRGIGVFLRGPGDIESIIVSNALIQTRLHTGHWWGKAEPIHISAVTGPFDRNLGCVRDVRFLHIAASGHAGILVLGSPASVLHDVRFEDVRLTLSDGPFSASHGGNFDLRWTDSVARGIFKHDIPGLYAQHVDGLEIAGLSVAWQDATAEYFTHALHCADVTRLTIDGFEGQAAQPDLPAIRLDRISEALG